MSNQEVIGPKLSFHSKYKTTVSTLQAHHWQAAVHLQRLKNLCPPWAFFLQVVIITDFEDKYNDFRELKNEKEREKESLLEKKKAGKDKDSLSQ